MPKRDNLKMIDQAKTSGSGASGLVVLADNVDRVDGFHAFPTPQAGALLALDSEGKFPASVLPQAAAGQITGHHGVQFFGPTAYLAAAVTAADTSILSTLPLFRQDDDVLVSRYDGYEWVRIADGGKADGMYWRYAVVRGQQKTNAQAFPVYSEIVLAGHPGTGGHILIDSGSGPDSPFMRVRSSEADGTFWFRGQFGKLATVPPGFRAVFPQFKAWDTTWGFATENGFLRGGIYAEYGDIAGDLSMSGTLTVEGPGDSRMQIGETVGGWGWSIRDAAGRPVIQALAPFVDANGKVISDVAFVIDNNGKPGLSYQQVAGTPSYRLDIGVDTLVGGSFRVGETFLVGSGAWGTDFAGVAINSTWGLVGLTAGNTFDATHAASGTDWFGAVEAASSSPTGTYEVWWDKATGKLFTGGGAIGFGRQGMTLKASTDPDLTSAIKWADTGRITMRIGSTGYRQGMWSVGQQTEIGYVPDMYVSMEGTGTGLQVWNSALGTNNVYTAPGDGAHLFYVGGELAMQIGKGGAMSLPITLAGSEVTAYWTERGRLGFGTDDPQALLHLVHATLPQLRIGGTSEQWTQFQTTADGTTWTTTGDVVLGPGTGTIAPAVPYGVSLGSPYRRYLDIYAGQLNVETLVAQQKIATIGGRVVVAPTTQLAVDVQTGDTVIFVKHNSLTSGDRILLEADGNLEAMAVTSAATVTKAGYRYSVTRNLDGSGANQWAAGAAVVNTGQAGSGWIDQYAITGLAKGTQYGPTIVGNVRLSSTWNDWRERWAIGNLNGLYGYGATTYGVAFGNPTATHITIDDTNGYRLRNNTTTLAQWAANGNLTLGATGAVSITAAGAATFSGKLTVGTGNNIAILDPNDATYRLWIGNASAAAAPFRVTQTGFVTATSGTVGGWTLGSSQLTGGNAVLSSTGVLTLGTGNNVIVLSAADATYRAWAGNALPASAPWHLTQGGYMKAISGTIGGWVLSSTALTSQSGSVTLNGSTNTISISGGGTLDVQGVMNASAMNITIGFTSGTALQTNYGNISFFGGAFAGRQVGAAIPTDLASCINSIKALRTALNNLNLTTVV